MTGVRPGQADEFERLRDMLAKVTKERDLLANGMPLGELEAVLGGRERRPVMLDDEPAAIAEAHDLRDKLASRDALLAEILGTYKATGSGHASKVGQVRLATWRRSAEQELTEREKRMIGG